MFTIEKAEEVKRIKATWWYSRHEHNLNILEFKIAFLLSLPKFIKRFFMKRIIELQNEIIQEFEIVNNPRKYFYKGM